MAIRIVLADDHQIVRQGLKAVLEKEGFQIVAEASDGREAIQMCQERSPEVAVLDISMPLLNGIDAAREITKVNSRTRTILLTQHTDDHFVLESLRAGITGYVLKTKAASELVQAIREVCKGNVYLSPGVSRTVVQAFLTNPEGTTADPLTSREREVLQLVAEGKTTKEIASLIGVSTKTAEKHREHIMEKLDIHDTAGLVRYALKRGLVPE